MRLPPYQCPATQCQRENESMSLHPIRLQHLEHEPCISVLVSQNRAAA